MDRNFLLTLVFMLKEKGCVDQIIFFDLFLGFFLLLFLLILEGLDITLSLMQTNLLA